MSHFTKLLLLIALQFSTLSLFAQSSCGQDEPFLLPPTSTFCADSSGMVTVAFKIYNNGAPGTYRVAFPDGSDTTYTGVVNTVEVNRRFLFNCGAPPGDPTPPSDEALYFEYASALTVTRTDCVDERGDNQKGTYDFRVVPNPIVDIKHSDLTCIEAPFKVNFEGKMCSDKLVEAYQWYVDGQKIEGATGQKYTGHVFGRPGTYTVKLEVTPYKGCDKYYYEKIIVITPKPEIQLSYTVDSTTLCDEWVYVTPSLTAEYVTAFAWSSNSEDVTFSDPAAANPVITIRNERAGTHRISVKAENENCSAKSKSFEVTTQRGQTIQVLDDIVTCTGYDLLLCNYLAYAPEPSEIRWTADRAGVSFDDDRAKCPVVRFTETGEHVLTASGRDACGVDYAIQVPVRVRDGERLEIDLSAVDTVCVTDGAFNLLDYITPADKVSEILGEAVNGFDFVPGRGAGATRFTVVDSCGYLYPQEIFVELLETYTGPSPTLCAGDSVDLFALQPGDYGGTGVRANVFYSEGLAAGTYRVAFRSRTRCGGDDTLTVTVQDYPVAGFAVVTDSCGAGPLGPQYGGLEPVRIKSKANAPVRTYRVLETGQQVSGRGEAQFRFAEAGVYTIEQVVGYKNSGCTDTLRRTLEVILPPAIDFAYRIDSTVCDSITLDLTAGPQAADVTYRWAFTNTLRSTDASPHLNLIRPLAPEVLGVDLSVINACYTTADTFGVVLPQRFRVSFDILNDNNTVCSEDTIFLANTSVNAKDFVVGYPDGRKARALPPYIILRNTGEKVMKYPITLRGSNDNCADQTAIDTIYVLPNETHAAFSLDYTDACSSNEVTLTNATTPGALCFVDWGDGSTPQAVDDLGSIGHFYRVNRDTSFEITLAARLCGRDTFRRRIHVRPTPDASFQVNAVDANCKNMDMVFTSSADTLAYGLSWSFGDGHYSQEATPVHAYARAGIYRVYCEAVSRDGCAARDSFDLRIGEYNGADLKFAARTSVCEGEPFGLELTAPLLGWQIDYGNGVVTDTPLERPFGEAGTYRMQLTATSANGCTVDSTVTVEVFPGFTADIRTAQRDTIVELGDALDLRVAVDPPRNVAAVYWTGDSIVDATAPYTKAYPVNEGIYGIRVEDIHGCTATDSMRVRVNHAYQDRIYAPNVFSPNGDGYNETFGLEVKENTVKRIRSMRVLNRFGAVVYECTDCATGSVGTGWDGTLGGKPLQGNVYIWAAEVDFVDGSSQVFTGDVTLLR